MGKLYGRVFIGRVKILWLYGIGKGKAVKVKSFLGAEEPMSDMRCMRRQWSNYFQH